MNEFIEKQIDAEEEKIKVASLEIIVTGTKDKPYFQLKYKEVGKEDYNIGYGSYELNYVFDWKEKCFEIVNQLAEEYNGGWINVNDRLPKENGKYLVYYRKWTLGNYLPKFDEKEIRILRYSTNGWFFPTYGDVEAEKDIHREVIAWQPLPEPYQPKGE